MSKKSFAADLVAGEEGYGWIELIPIVLPILLNLPCLKNKTPEAQKEWIEDHPGLSRIHTIKAIREKDPKVSRKEASRMANKAIDKVASQSVSEFAANLQD